MTLRRRAFALVALAICTILLCALGLLDVLTDRTLRQQLDSALLTHARTEAASAYDHPSGVADLHELPMQGREGALPKYAAIYDLRTGVLLDRTQNMPSPPPLPDDVRRRCGAGEEILTELWVSADEPERQRHLRGVWLPAPGPPEPLPPRAVLLMGVPDELLDQVHRQRRSAALVTVVIGLLVAFLVARLIARRLTLGTEAIAGTARAVAAGDMARRVDLTIPDAEIAGLSRDLNDMIDRLASLLVAQRRFTSDAAHELRLPITAVIGQLEVALRQERPAADYRECLESCLEDMQRLSALAEDLLALARLEGRPERAHDPVDLREVARETLAQQSEHVVAAGVELVLLPGPAAPTVGDALQLGRMLRNLIENAVRVSAAGQAVEIEVLAEADHVVARVMDRGPGLAAGLRGRIFEPFMRSDEGRGRAVGGTGLGLAIAQQIARVHGGDLTYSDRPGGGALFTATLR